MTVNIGSTGLRFAALCGFGLLLSGTAGAVVIHFDTGTPTTGSCFAVTVDSVAGGCQTSGGNPVTSLAFTNLQGDTATITWNDFTSSAAVAAGGFQSVQYGKFQLVYTSNAGDSNTVSIPQTSLLLKIRETLPTAFQYATILLDLNSGYIGPAATDLQATFSPASVTDGALTTFSASGPQALVDPSRNFGSTIITGQVAEASSIPEPVTVGMIGVGLVAIGLWSRKRR